MVRVIGIDHLAIRVRAPAAHPNYGEGYYAVYFLDPDGLKLEVKHFVEKQKRRARLAL